VYNSMEEYSISLTYYEKALEIQEKTLPANHLDLSKTYNNMASIYHSMKENQIAQSYYEKAVAIIENAVPPNYSLLVTIYNNIGELQRMDGNYSAAISFFQKICTILQQENDSAFHIEKVQIFHNIASVYECMGEDYNALSYHEKIVEIHERTCPTNYSELATSFNNIARLY
ncbi:unnamed protein product, partial [Rotaria socialis]